MSHVLSAPAEIVSGTTLPAAPGGPHTAVACATTGLGDDIPTTGAKLKLWLPPYRTVTVPPEG
jgi:hypothetical protein